MQKAKFHQALLVAAAIAVLAAVPASASVTPPNPAVSEATVVVRNFNSRDVRVVAVTETGKRFELGTVQRSSKRAFKVPDRLLNENEPFVLKVYSLERPTPPSIIDHVVSGVRTQLLSPKNGEEITLNLRIPLTESFIDRSASTP
jgi:hypothetical protein